MNGFKEKNIIFKFITKGDQDLTKNLDLILKLNYKNKINTSIYMYKYKYIH